MNELARLGQIPENPFEKRAVPLWIRTKCSHACSPTFPSSLIDFDSKHFPICSLCLSLSPVSLSHSLSVLRVIDSLNCCSNRKPASNDFHWISSPTEYLILARTASIKISQFQWLTANGWKSYFVPSKKDDFIRRIRNQPSLSFFDMETVQFSSKSKSKRMYGILYRMNFVYSNRNCSMTTSAKIISLSRPRIL